MRGEEEGGGGEVGEGGGVVEDGVAEGGRQVGDVEGVEDGVLDVDGEVGTEGWVWGGRC